ncbi:MAG: c-type cytochrome [Bryobacteraceae bacterium]
MALSGCAPSGPGVVPPPGKIVEGNRQSVLQPGGPRPQRTARNPFEGDEEAIQTGKRLFSQFNCAGCHAAGGGAIGPALIDDQWTYGSSSENIFWTIIEGRPQGMPSFGGRISEDQAWRIVAFVRSIAGGLSRDEKSGVEAAP